MREPEALDLSPLDPRPETERWDGLVASIMARCAGELQRRQSQRRLGVFDGLLAWTRPALATAAALAALSLVALSRNESLTSNDDSSTFIWSARLPAPVEVWLQEGQPPTMLDMLVLDSGEN
jgi:hypothetical protein